MNFSSKTLNYNRCKKQFCSKRNLEVLCQKLCEQCLLGVLEGDSLHNMLMDLPIGMALALAKNHEHKSAKKKGNF